MKTQTLNSNNTQYLTHKQDETLNAKVGAAKISKKTLKKYKDTEEELEKIRREIDSQDTRLLKIQNLSRQVEEDYQGKKKEVENKLMELSRRKQAFADKQKKAKEALNQEEERVKKIENKKIQERTRLDENEAKINELRREREEKEKLRQELLNNKQKLEDEVNELKKFEDFLKEVMKQSPDFFDEVEGQDGLNVQNLIAKHARIKNNKKRFEEEMERIDTAKEQETEEFQKYKKEQEEIILIDTSKIYALQEQVEELNKERSKVQSEINRIEQKTNLENAKWSQIIMAIANLNNRAKEAKDLRDQEKRKEKESLQPISEGIDEKSEKNEKKKKDLRKWDDIKTEDQLESLQYVEEQIDFLKEVRKRWIERTKKAQ